MTNEIKPTDSIEERDKGKIPVWLDPEDVIFITNEWRKIPENAPDEILEKWSRVAFRLSAALHKHGVDYEPEFPSEDETYKST